MAIREGGSTAAGASVTDVVEFDLVVSHLRLPELV